MRALIAAGGHATRLRPLTTTTNKHLIPLANKPMIFNAIEKVVEAGISDIIINVNPKDTEIERAIGNGSRFGCRIACVEQTGGPKGLAHIIKNAEPHLRGEPFLFYLGDNIILGSLKQMVERFHREELDCMLAFARVRDPERFGVPVFENGRITRIEEKPEHPQCDFAQCGIYLYNDSVFEAVNAIQPSGRGEYEISDANTYIINAGKRIGWEEITGWWKDTGKPDDLLEGNQLLLDEMRFSDKKINGMIGPNVTIHGCVQIGKNTTVWNNVLIRGPVIIGENTVIENSYIGPYTSIGSHCVIRNTEIEHSIVFDRATIQSDTRVVDSIIGKYAIVSAARASLPLGHKLIIGDNSQVEI